MGENLVQLDLNPLELRVIHLGLEKLLEDPPIDSILTDGYIQRMSEDFRNASNDKLMESTVMSGRIRWSLKKTPALKDILGVRTDLK